MTAQEDVEAARELLVNLAETDRGRMDEVLGLIFADEPGQRAQVRTALLRIAAAKAELQRRDEQEGQR